MTVQEMIEQVYELSGELTQIEPYEPGGAFDFNSPGAQKTLRYLRNAQIAVTSWKHPRTKQHFVWKDKYVQKFLTSPVIDSGTAGITPSRDVVVFVPPAGSVGKYLYIDDLAELRQIIVQTPTEVIVDQEFSAITTGMEYRVLANFFEIDANERWLTIAQVLSLPDRFELIQVRDREYFVNRQLEIGLPTSWYRSGRRIYVDSVFLDPGKVSCVVLEAPRELAEADQSPDLPEQFHYAYVLWALIQVYGMAQETNMKYSFTKQFEEFMTTTQTSIDYDDQDLAGSISVGGF